MSTRAEKPSMKIGTKLILIVSGIIILSLATMTVLATVFFKRDNETRLRENNHQLAGIIALKVKSDITSLIADMRFAAAVLKDGGDRQKLAERFFTSDSIAAAALVRRDGERGNVRVFLANPAAAMPVEKFREVLLDGERFVRAVNGETVVDNVSDILGVPAVAVAVPTGVGEYTISLCKAAIFLDAFRQSGITETFMVNGAGDVIAHPKGEIVLAKGNYRTLPVVAMMLTSPTDNSETRYVFSGIRYRGAFKKIGIGGVGVIATAAEDKVFAEVYNIQRRNLLISIIVLTLAILVVYFFAKTLTGPIVRLVKATKDIEEGRFNVAITAASGDEIGVLTRSFVQMGKGLEERERIKEAFGKFVNKDIAERAAKGEIKLGGERKRVTVFFSDIRSFTAMSEKLSPEEVVDFLNQYMGRMVRCIEATGGVVDKFIGDAIMAVWGAPVSTGQDTASAIDAVLAMRESLKEFNVGRGTDTKPRISIGAGIHSGDVLVGQIGSEHRLEYTVIGDTVNLTSRIESLTKPFGADILISEEAYREVKDRYTFAPMKKIKVKGKTEPQQVYAVLGRIGDAKAFRSIEELRSTLGIVLKDGVMGDDEEEKKYEILDA
ncbi:MAG: adenylate/guanylate cyclase domain-containing protein [Spirochaetota bacterium]